MIHQDYNERRKKVLNQLDDKSIAIISSGSEILRNGDSNYYFRPNSNFYYLTGFSESNAIAVLIPGSKYGDFILFNAPRDKAKEQWDGYLAGQEGACKIYGADHAFPRADFEALLPMLFEGRTKVYYDLGRSKLDETIIDAISGLRRKVRTGVEAPTDILSIEKIIHDLRLIKSPHEVELMRHAATATVEGHKKAMQTSKPGLYEYHLAAELHYQFEKHGCRQPAYNSIVGSGRNGCILHYNENADELKDGDLVLIDAGGEYKNYAADVTRTFPVNGKFTPEQKAIYELVLAAQKAAIAEAQPGKPWNAMQQAIYKVLTQGLVDLGILSGDVNQLIEEKAYFPFYMHNSGHWIGMDVHDVGTYKISGQWRTLEAGMVITIEPGIYISADIPGVDPKWHNIGVRIEDDILITQDGNDILTKDLPKEVADIESLMNG